MTFEERIVPPLCRLAHQLVDRGAFGYLESIANFLNALASGRWRQLPADEQLLWLERLAGLLGPRALGDSWDADDTHLNACLEMVYWQQKAIERQL